MRKNKVISAEEAIALIRENDVVTTTGFVQSCIPEALHAALEKLSSDLEVRARRTQLQARLPPYACLRTCCTPCCVGLAG